MATFEMSQGEKTYTFDLQGGAQCDGKPCGVWTTDKESRLVVLPLEAPPQLPFDPDETVEPIATFDVIWQFNDKNQLTLSAASQDDGDDQQSGSSNADDNKGGSGDKKGGTDDKKGGTDGKKGGTDDKKGGTGDKKGGAGDDDAGDDEAKITELINFNTVGKIPYFYTVDAVLHVFPDSAHRFGFKLRGEWDITDSHELSFTVGTTTSVIDGYLQDPKSRFMYHFFDKDNISINAILGFVGSWDSTTDDGVVTLEFTYKREDGSSDKFTLPGSVVVNRGTNQLAYEYSREGEQPHRIQLLGFLEINDNFQINYTLDRQVSRRGEEQTASTTFTIDTVYSNDNFSGDLKLIVQKNDGTPGTVITIAGHMTAVLKQTQLAVGFAFTQHRHGEQVTSEIAFNGSLHWSAGTVQWSFERNSEHETLSIAASDIRLSAGRRLDGRLNIEAADGQIKGVRALFGISF